MNAACEEPLVCVNTSDHTDKICQEPLGTAKVRVFSDLDSSGVMDMETPGLAEIQLRVMTMDDSGKLEPVSDEVGLTGVDGWATLTELPRNKKLKVQVLNPPSGAVRSWNNRTRNDELDSDLLDGGLSDVFQITDELVFTNTSLGYRMPTDVTIRVFNDVDGDGIHDSWEPGLEGIKVKLITSEGADLEPMDHSSNAHREVVTDDRGYATFYKLPQDSNLRAKVIEGPAGGVATHARVGKNPTVDSDLRDDGTSYGFRIKSTEPVYTSLDLGYRLPKTVTVRVWSDDNKNGIQDEGEEGIKGIKLRLLYASNHKNLAPVPVGTAHKELKTNSGGLVRFTNVPIGVKLVVKVTDHPDDAVATVFQRGDDPLKDSNLKYSGYSSQFDLRDMPGKDYRQISLGYKFANSFKVRAWDDADGDGMIGKCRSKRIVELRTNTALDSREEGIEGVAIQVFDDKNRKKNYSPVVKTDRFGYATFYGLPRDVRLRAKVINEPIGAVRTKQNSGRNRHKDSDLGLSGLTDRFIIERKFIPSVGIGYLMPVDMVVRVWDDADNNGRCLAEVMCNSCGLRDLTIFYARRPKQR